MDSLFSFIILTYNEEQHLPRLLKSIKGLKAPIYILDSGSIDSTLKVAEEYNAIVEFNTFKNHPTQWQYALKIFDVKTPWIIGLDADQIVTPELFELLQNFKEEEIDNDVDGIYFNRKNYFRGKWLRYGGYYPFYLLKMFRNGKGKSDINENMDHRFIVPGKTIIWKKGHLKEENLKENNIDFWLNKHIKYSTLVAEEEIERMRQLRVQSIKPNLFGSPDEKTAYLKKIWWKLPLYYRPFIYFFYRFIIKLGCFDSKEGRLFHFLQGFWFRLMVDVKIEELKKKEV